MKKITTSTKTVDAFIKSFPDDVQKILKRIRKEIKTAAPKTEESISYGIPAYKFNGKPLIYFSGYKKHIGLYPMTGGVKEKFKKELEGYKMSTGTVQFKLSEPIPYDLISKITKFKLKSLKSDIM